MGKLTEWEAWMGCVPAQKEIVREQYERIAKAQSSAVSKFRTYENFCHNGLEPLLRLDKLSFENLAQIDKATATAIDLIGDVQKRFEAMRHKSNHHHYKEYKRYGASEEAYNRAHDAAVAQIKMCQDEKHQLIFDKDFSHYRSSYQTILSSLDHDVAAKIEFDRTYGIAYDALQKFSHLPRYKHEHKYLQMTRDIGLFQLDTVTSNFSHLKSIDVSDNFHLKACLLGEKYKKFDIKNESYGLVQLWVAKKDQAIAVNEMASLGCFYVDLEFKSLLPKFTYSDYLQGWLDLHPECLFDDSMHGPFDEASLNQMTYFEKLRGLVYLKQDQFDETSLGIYERCLRLDPGNQTWREGIAHTHLNDFYAQFRHIMNDANSPLSANDKASLDDSYGKARASLALIDNPSATHQLHQCYALASFKQDSLTSNLDALDKELDPKLHFSKSIIIANKLHAAKDYKQGVKQIQASLKADVKQIDLGAILDFTKSACKLYQDGKEVAPSELGAFVENWIESNQCLDCKESLAPLGEEIKALKANLDSISDIDLHQELSLIIKDKEAHLAKLQSLQVTLVEAYFAQRRIDDQALALYDNLLKTDLSLDTKLAVASLNIEARQFGKVEAMLADIQLEKAQPLYGEMGRIQTENFHAAVMFARMIILSNTASKMAKGALNIGYKSWRLNYASQMKIAKVFSDRLMPILEFASRPSMINLAFRCFTAMPSINLQITVPYLQRNISLMIPALDQRHPLAAYHSLYYNTYTTSALGLSVLADIARKFGPKAAAYLKEKYKKDEKTIVFSFSKIKKLQQISVNQDTLDVAASSLPNTMQLASRALILNDSFGKLKKHESNKGYDISSRARMGTELVMLATRMITEGVYLSKAHKTSAKFLAFRDLINEQTMVERLVSMTVTGYFSVIRPAALDFPILKNGLNFLSSKAPKIVSIVPRWESFLTPISSSISFIDAAMTVGNVVANFTERSQLFHIQMALKHFLEHGHEQNYRPLEQEGSSALVVKINFNTKKSLWFFERVVLFLREVSMRSKAVDDRDDSYFYDHHNKHDVLQSYQQCHQFLQNLRLGQEVSDQIDGFMINTGYIVHRIGTSEALNGASGQLQFLAAQAITSLLAKDQIERFYKRFPIAGVISEKFLAMSFKTVLQNKLLTYESKVEFLNKLKSQPQMSSFTHLIQKVIDYVCFVKNNPKIEDEPVEKISKLKQLEITLAGHEDFAETKKILQILKYPMLLNLKQWQEIKACHQELILDDTYKKKVLTQLYLSAVQFQGSIVEKIAFLDRLNRDLFEGHDQMIIAQVALTRLNEEPTCDVMGFMTKLYQMHNLELRIHDYIRTNKLELNLNEIVKQHKQTLNEYVQAIVGYIYEQKINQVLTSLNQFAAYPECRNLMTASDFFKDFIEISKLILEVDCVCRNQEQLEALLKLHKKLKLFLSDYKQFLEQHEKFASNITTLQTAFTYTTIKIGVYYFNVRNLTESLRFFEFYNELDSTNESDNFTIVQDHIRKIKAIRGGH